MEQSVHNMKSMKPYTICIIGNGYLGSYLYKRLYGYKCTVISSEQDYKTLTKEQISSFDVFIHLVHESNQDSNKLGIKHLLKSMNSQQALIYASSISVYTESDYGKQKVELEDIIHDSSKNAIVLRLGTVVGNSLKENNNIISKMLQDAMVNGTVTYYNPDYTCNILGLDDFFNCIKVTLSSLKQTFEMFDLVSYNIKIKDITLKLQESNVNCVLEKKETTKDGPVLNGNLFESRHNALGFKFKDKFKLDYTLLPKCVCCDTQLNSVLDLGMQVLVNDYLDSHQVCDSKFPIKLNKCTRCFHLQLSLSVNPERLFRYYTYKSGVSNTMLEYFDSFADRLPKSTSSVLEIASNDSSQLKAIKSKFGNVLLVGVEPATNLIPKDENIKVINEFFGTQECSDKLKVYETFDVIVAQNVFAHIPNPYTFLQECKKLMNGNSVIYIQVSQSNMIKNNEFDTLYHEHISFFNTYSMKMLCERVGLHLTNVEKVKVHGSSYLFTISFKDSDDNVYDLLDYEMSTGLFDESTYITYANNVKLEKNRIVNKLFDYYQKGIQVIGYGSTAKINVVFNTCNITNKYIKCIVDENPLKIGKYTSFGDIPIVSSKVFEQIEGDNVIVLILAWNFEEEIRRKIPGKFKVELL